MSHGNPVKQLQSTSESIPAHGSKLDANAYDGFGRLLLSAGTRLDESLDLERLLQSDVVFQPPICPDSAKEKKAPASSSKPPARPQAQAETIDEIVQNYNENLTCAEKLRNSVSSVVQTVFQSISTGDKPDAKYVYEVVDPLLEGLKHNRSLLLSLVNLKDADEYTYGHCVNVGILASAFGLHYDLPSDIEQLVVGAVMHDIGKMLVPSPVLNKPNGLAELELKQMRRHPLLGARIMMEAGGFDTQVIETVLSHHESVDGRGYPYAKTGPEIGWHAKITSIADVYDALTTDRPYRKALPPKTALITMATKLHASFEPALLSLFIKMIGYYPVGTVVKLNTGCEAQVVSINPNNPEQPALVLITKGSNGGPLSKPVLIDIESQPRIHVIGSPGESPRVRTDTTIFREYRPFSAVA